MTMLRDLRPGTRCLVDVAAMERDGPEMHSCGHDQAGRRDAWQAALRVLAEQIVVVTQPEWTEWPCCGALREQEHDEVGVSCHTGRGLSGFALRRKYLLPLPEQGGETDGR